MTLSSNVGTRVLAGYGFDGYDPYLEFICDNSDVRERYAVRGRTFSLRQLPQRFCTGRFDLASFKAAPCPLHVELLPDAKDNACPACMEATGFNPSFYYSDLVSPQQRAYNETPHMVYLAYFSPQHVKAGISGERRGIARLLEQGARAARIVGRFENAYEARKLEAALCVQPGILETMRASKKVDLLVDERYSFEEAHEVLGRELDRLVQVEAVVAAGLFTGAEAEEIQDFSPYYFGGPSPSSDSLQRAEGTDGVCGGHCIGMVGSTLVFEQGGTNFVAPIKDWESHVIELLDNQIACTYNFTPQQMSLL